MEKKEGFIKKNFLGNVKGQMAIFVVLIFQVLFILFAMSINVALVVHDKINLQNSLDLAAYYGAKKQAEVLNAMAHINYQMRQNWKLLAWRYRILGTLAQEQGRRDGIPSDKCPPSSSILPITEEYWCPQNKDCDTACLIPTATGPKRTLCEQARGKLQSRGIHQGNYCDKSYFLCISNDLWKRGIKRGVNVCRTIGYYVPPIENVAFGTYLGWALPEAGIVASITNILQTEADHSCKKEGALNWLMTQIFLSHFRLDQKDRKTMLREIYNRTLKEGKDLDGELIFEGAKKVFLHNLNAVNKRNFQAIPDALEDFNSFKDIPFGEIFEYVNTFPILRYFDTEGTETGDECSNSTTRDHYHYHKNPPPPGDFFASAIDKLQPDTQHPLYTYLNAEPAVKALFSFNGHNILPEDENNPVGGLTLSFIKKPEQVLYYALRLEFRSLPQHQIFSLSLSGGVTFKASSFAKPFGASFGPTSNQSDPLIPIRTPTNLNGISQLNPYLLQPNYSRWPGDQWGLLDKALHYHGSGGEHFLKKYSGSSSLGGSFHYNMEDFLHLILYSAADDPLARPARPGGGSIHEMGFIRLMELMAIYPDLYDLSYYSISANYMQTYFPKICKLLRNGSACQSGPMDRNEIAGVSGSMKTYVRGDFGWPEWKFYLDRNQSKKQVDLSIAPYFLKQGPPGSPSPWIDPSGINTRVLAQPGLLPVSDLTSRRIFYRWLALDLPGGLLSSWAPTQAPTRYEEYQFPDLSFLKCNTKALRGKAVPSSCVVGGRSGYSVKLISCETVQALDSHLQPSNIDEYCP